MDAPILLLTKQDIWSQRAGDLAQATFGNHVLWERGAPGDEPPSGFALPAYDMVLSFLSPWIVPKEILEKSPLSLNFHPGSCDYPGIGCYNFALYEEAAQFGAVCHHMLPKVDSGEIVRETLFPVLPEDRVETLKLRTMVAMLALFHEIITLLAQGKPLPKNSRQWTRQPLTRKELNALCEITPDMDKDEVSRRIRATTYPGYPGPYLLKDGQKIAYPVPPGPPLA